MNKWKIGTALLLLITGVLVLCYPAVSDAVAKRNYSKAIQQYNITVDQLSKEEIEKQFILAETYHEFYVNSGILDPFVSKNRELLPDDYLSVLNINGIMGYIEIPGIDVYLPIFHSTSDEVLKKGAGHLEMTAFPIGKQGGHAVITAHRGLPSAKLFTDLNLMNIGDIFYIHILDRTLAYETDQIVIAEPFDTEALRPVEGRDYVTLITCTPYAINSHRLLVRGIRLTSSDSQEEAAMETAVFNNTISRFFLPVILLITVVIVFVIIWVIKKKNRLLKN